MHSIDYRYILVLTTFCISCHSQRFRYPIIRDRKSISIQDESFNSNNKYSYPLDQPLNSNIRHFSPYRSYKNSDIEVSKLSPYKVASRDKDVDTLLKDNFPSYEEDNPIKRTALYRHHNRNPPPKPGDKPKPKPPRVVEHFGQDDVVDITQVVIIGFNVVGLLAMWILIIWFNGWDSLDILMGDNFNWQARQLQGLSSSATDNLMQDITSFVSNIINKADFVDLAFTTVGVTDKDCIDLALCNMRQYLQDTPLVSIIAAYVGLEDMSIFKNYRYAMELGMNNTSCENNFALCQSI